MASKKDYSAERRAVESWEKPLSMPKPVPKPSATKKKRGRPAKDAEE